MSLGYDLLWNSLLLELTNWGRCHFAKDILKCIFLNENAWILIKISLKFVPKGPVNNIPALVQIMAWHRSGDKHYLNQWWLFYGCIYASLGLNEWMAWYWSMTKDPSYINESEVSDEFNRFSVAFCAPNNIPHLEIHKARNYQLFPGLATSHSRRKSQLDK